MNWCEVGVGAVVIGPRAVWESRVPMPFVATYNKAIYLLTIPSLVPLTFPETENIFGEINARWFLFKPAGRDAVTGGRVIGKEYYTYFVAIREVLESWLLI